MGSLLRIPQLSVDLHSSREAGSAQGPPSATERRECKSRVTLLLRDADSGQIDHMAAEPTHGPHHSCSSSSWLGARGPFLATVQYFRYGGSITETYRETELPSSQTLTETNIQSAYKIEPLPHCISSQI